MDQLTAFPVDYFGVFAQTVPANSKCSGCVHYDRNRGRTGVCVIGLQPSSCGDGSNSALTGYAPLTSMRPDYEPMAPNARPTDGKDGLDMTAFAVKVSTLGEEHVDMVKSFAVEARQQHPAFAKPHYAVDVDALSEHVASLFKSALSNRDRLVLGSEDELACVFVKSVLTNAADDIDAIRDDVTHTAVVKGLYGAEWLTQFTGTPLFDRAVALAERELAAERKRVAQRLAEAKVRRKLNDQIDAYDVSTSWETMRNDKEQLLIDLAKHRQKVMKTTQS